MKATRWIKAGPYAPTMGLQRLGLWGVLALCTACDDASLLDVTHPILPTGTAPSAMEFLEVAEACARHFPDFERTRTALAKAGATLRERRTYPDERDGEFGEEYVFGNENRSREVQEASARVYLADSVLIGESFFGPPSVTPHKFCDVSSRVSDPEAVAASAEDWLQSVLPDGTPVQFEARDGDEIGNPFPAGTRGTEQMGYFVGTYRVGDELVRFTFGTPILNDLEDSKTCGSRSRCRSWGEASLLLEIDGTTSPMRSARKS